MSSILAELRARGFINQTTDDAGLEKVFAAGPVTLYAGFDPSATSFHVGNLVQILLLMHFQRAGHRPIAIVGGGTGMVGDPSGKQEMRKLLGREEISGNLNRIRAQLERFIEFQGGRAMLLDNSEWLADLNYIEFLREIGRHFSVNRMLAAECFKTRLDSEAGLSFLEFNYMLLQAYDFLELSRRHGCRVQVGGSDQWGNIVAGVDLIRRVEGKEAYGLTTPLVTTASGAKMGKTAAGAVWLDPERLPAYDFYQYWINTDDRDVGRFLKLFTFLPLDRIAELERLQGADLRGAKEVLALEATTLVHGEAAARQAQEAARAIFGGKGIRAGGAAVPTRTLGRADLEKSPLAVNLFAEFGLCKSRGDARRTAQQGGLYINGVAIREDRTLTPADMEEGVIELRVGKRQHLRLEISG